MRFILVKKIRTYQGNLLLTHQDGVTMLPKAGEGSRLENWRKLMVPGREVEILHKDPIYPTEPLLATLHIAPEDDLVWDSAPVEIPQHVPFWTKLALDDSGIDTNNITT
jgi:hypothetical protein